MELDKKERTILCELDCNARQSLASIGKVAHLAKESVHYRIHQLEKKGVIKGYPAIIGLAKIGKMHAELYLRLQNTTLPLKETMKNFFIQLPEVIAVASIKGSWDYVLGFVVHDLRHLHEVKNKIFDTYGEYIAASSLTLTIETYFFGRKYLVGKNIHMTCHIDKPGNITLDALDEKILSLLAVNAREKILTIAEKVQASPKLVAARIKRLEKNGIIQKYTIALNTEALGISTYRLLLRLKQSSHKTRFIEFFHHHPYAITVREVLGDWNLEPTFEVPSPEVFYQIVHEIEERFGESLVSHTVLMVDSLYKINYYH